MRKSLLLVFAIALAITFAGRAGAQVTTNGGSGLAGTYPSLASAISALNAATITSPVIITLTGNETAPSGGYQISASGTAANTIIIQGSGSTITASGAQVAGSIMDAIFKIVGGDYITIQNFTMQENAANTVSAVATNNMTEFGVALLYATVTNGAQNNNIKNNTITLNRSYLNTFGVYSNTRHGTDPLQAAEVTAASGSNSFNKVYGNSISNVNFGIVFIGAGTTIAAIDDGNDIGGSSVSTGNTLFNWGGGAAASAYISLTTSSAGIYLNQQINDNISYNTITSASGLTMSTVMLSGILAAYSVAQPTTGTFYTNINYNTVSVSADMTTGALVGINNQGLATAVAGATININNNNVQNCALTGAGATTASFTGLNNLSASGVLNINNNTIVSATLAAATGQYAGIYNGGATVTTQNFNNNQIGNGTNPALTLTPTATSNQVIGIFNAAGATTAVTTINGNLFQGFSYPVANAGLFRAINHQIQVLSVTINTNNFNNITINSSASNSGLLIYASSLTPTVTVSGNFITTQFTNAHPTGGANNLFIYNAGLPTTGTSTVTNNNLSNITCATTTSFAAGIYWSVGNATPYNHSSTVTGNTVSYFSNVGIGTSTQAANTYGILVSYGNSNVVSNNTVFNLQAAGGTAIGIFCGSPSGNAAGNWQVANNLVHDIKSTSWYGQQGAAGAGSAQGMQVQGGPAVVNIYKNKIYDISCVVSPSNGAGTSLGLTVSQASATCVCNIYNNYIGRIISDNSQYYQALRGINLGSTVANTTNLSYNTVLLDANCPVESFIIYKSSATSKAAFNNNLFINNCTDAGYEQFVYFFVGTLAANTPNYLTTSNNNLLYCGTPGTLHCLYGDGAVNAITDKKQTLTDLQTAFAPRESNSRTENTTFSNTTTGSATNYLHVNPAVPTQAESAAVNITGITDDYDGDVRFGNPGYTGTGTAPDIGADEFNGIAVIPCSGTPGASTIVGPAGVCTGTGADLTLSAAYNFLGISYQWKYATTAGGPYTNLGTLATQSTGNLTATTYYICVVTCSNSGLSFTTPEKTVSIYQYPTATATNSSPVCEGGTVTLTGTTDFGTTFTWTGPNGFTASTQNATTAALTAAGYGTYVFTASANGCATEGYTKVIVNSAPAAPVVTPASATILEGTIQPLTATGGLVNQTILQEDFNGNVPGWTTVNNSTGGTPSIGAWLLYLSAPSFHSNDNTNFILSNSDGQGAGGITNAELISPSFSTVGFTSASLTYYHYFRYTTGQNDTAQVQISTDGGTTWSTTPLILYNSTQGTATAWVQETINLTSFLGQSNLKIRFKYYSEYGWYWGVDNVKVTGSYQADITWAPTTGLYTNAGATTPYTGGNATALWAKPLTTTTYIASSSSLTPCTSSTNVLITVDPLVPAFTYVDGVTIGEETTSCFNASNTLTVAATSPVTVGLGGIANFIAGVKILFKPGFQVQNGGYAHGYISTVYCGAVPPLPAAPATGVETDGRPSLQNANFSLFPNPTSGNFTLVQKGDRLFGTVNVEIYGTHGERVLSSQMVGEKQHEFITSDLPTGIYFVKIVADGYTETIKLIRTR